MGEIKNATKLGLGAVCIIICNICKTKTFLKDYYAYFEHILSALQLTWSEEIGNILKELDMDKSLIFYMFLRSFLPKKIAERTSDMRDFGNALSYIKANDLDLDFTSFLRETCRVSPEDGLETAKIIVKKFKESLNNEKVIYHLGHFISVTL